MKTSKYVTITKSRHKWKIARNIFIGLATLSTAFTIGAFVVGNVVNSSEKVTRSAQFEAIYAKAEPRKSFIKRTLAQAGEDYAAGRISLTDYVNVYGSMDYVKTDLSDSNYILTYGTPELKAEYQALLDECYKPALPYNNAAKFSLIPTVLTLAGLTLTAIQTSKLAKKEDENTQSFL